MPPRRAPSVHHREKALQELRAAAAALRARRRHGDAAAAACLFAVVEPVHVEDVFAVYAGVFAAGRRGESPREQIALLREHGPEWVLAKVPIAALNYQTAEESSEERIARARAYAARPGVFPPGIALYGARSQRRGVGQGFVMDGNHRVLAARMRGDCAVRMFMPASDYAALARDARERGFI
jgi:hypothetical protein